MTGQTLTHAPIGDAVQFADNLAGAGTITLRTTPAGTRFLMDHLLISINGLGGGDGAFTLDFLIGGVSQFGGPLNLGIVVNGSFDYNIPLNLMHIGDGVETITVVLGALTNCSTLAIIKGFDS